MQRLSRRHVDRVGVGIARDNALPAVQREASTIGRADESDQESASRSLEEEGDTLHARGGERTTDVVLRWARHS